MLKPKDFPAKKNHIKIPSSFIINNDNFVRGDSGLLSVENKYLLPEELESVRKLAVRFFRKNKTSTMCKNPFLFFRVFPYLSLTAKPKAVRMGKGKGFHVL
jgi:ribosomal protein L16/L10AE